MACPWCGVQELGSGDVDGMCFSCRSKAAVQSQKPLIFYTNMGWVCPKCGSTYSPFIAECYRCNEANSFAKPGLSGGTASPIRNDNAT